jgi:hypothetical protein
MYGYNPLAIDQLAKARITQMRGDAGRSRHARRLRKAGRRGNSNGDAA